MFQELPGGISFLSPSKQQVAALMSCMVALEQVLPRAAVHAVETSGPYFYLICSLECPSSPQLLDLLKEGMRKAQAASSVIELREMLKSNLEDFWTYHGRCHTCSLDSGVLSCLSVDEVLYPVVGIDAQNMPASLAESGCAELLGLDEQEGQVVITGICAATSLELKQRIKRHKKVEKFFTSQDPLLRGRRLLAYEEMQACFSACAKEEGVCRVEGPEDEAVIEDLCCRGEGKSFFWSTVAVEPRAWMTGSLFLWPWERQDRQFWLVPVEGFALCVTSLLHFIERSFNIYDLECRIFLSSCDPSLPGKASKREGTWKKSIQEHWNKPLEWCSPERQGKEVVFLRGVYTDPLGRVWSGPSFSLHTEPFVTKKGRKVLVEGTVLHSVEKCFGVREMRESLEN